MTDASGNPVAAVTTDAAGKYMFENLLPGDYKITFTNPVGYERLCRRLAMIAVLTLMAPSLW